MGWNMDFGYKEGERYKIVNPELNDHNKMFTVIKVEVIACIISLMENLQSMYFILVRFLKVI